METSTGTEREPRRRRRRSSQKSSKTKHQQRMQLKKLGYLLLTGLIGGVLVAGIAVLAGGSGN